MTELIREQILYIRDLGLTNMFDVNNVQFYAQDFGFNELVKYIEEDRQRYFNFILNGKEIKQ